MTLDRSNIIRWCAVVLMFCCIFEISGIKGAREAQQMILMLSCISLFSLLLNNIWATLFVLWTVFLYAFFKFQGGEYLSNVFFAAILYKLTQISFKKEHIGFFIDGFLWFVCFNIAYGAIQVAGYDFIYTVSDEFNRPFEINILNTQFAGFMNHKSITASLLAMAIPVMAAREGKHVILIAIAMLFPLYLCKTSLCLIAGLIGLLFVIYHKFSKKLSIGAAILMILFGSFYVAKVDKMGFERFGQWRLALKHYIVHPLTGYGLGSFANITKHKDFKFLNAEGKLWNQKTNKRVTVYELWDNPHNLIVSLLYEFGLIGLIITGAYFIQNAFKFNKAIKSPAAIGLTGFIVVFLIVSMGHFPIFLARMACFIVPMLALHEMAIA